MEISKPSGLYGMFLSAWHGLNVLYVTQHNGKIASQSIETKTNNRELLK